MGHSHDRKALLRTSGTVILAVLATGLLLGACSTPKNAAANSTTTSAAASGSTTTTAAASTSTTVAAPTTTTSIPFSVSQVKKGTGPASLAEFTVPTSAKEWDIDWEYDCTKTAAKTGTFAVSVKGYGSTSGTTDAGVPQQSSHGFAGIAKNFDTGSFSLNVTTPCTWTVRVEVLS